MSLVIAKQGLVLATGSLMHEKIISGWAFAFGQAIQATWTTIDLTVKGVPSNAHGALVQVYVQTTIGPDPPGGCYIRFRRPGESADTNESNWFYVYPAELNFISGGPTSAWLVYLPLTDGECQYTKSDRITVGAKLITYFVESFKG